MAVSSRAPHLGPSTQPCGRRSDASKVCRATKAIQPVTLERAQLNGFTRWAIDRGIRFSGLRPDSPDGQSRGLYATALIQPGSRMVSVPKSAALSLAGADADGVPWWGAMAKQILSLPQSFSPYQQLLPSAVDLPVLWSAEEVKELQCPFIVAKVAAEQLQWSQVTTQLQPWLAAQGRSPADLQRAMALARSRSFEAPRFNVPMAAKAGVGLVTELGLMLLALTRPEQPLELWLLLAALGLLPAAGLAAWDLQQARSQVQFVVAPFLDLLNHSSTVATEVSYDWVREAFIVTSSHSYQPGQQVFISYGELSNDALLQQYGFVEPDNPHDRYMLTGLGSQLLRGPLAQALSPTEALTAAVEGEAARGGLEEVVVTRKGISTEVRQALARLLSLAQPAGPHNLHLTPLTVDGVLAAALSDELCGLGTDVTADEAELAAIDMPAAAAALEPDAGLLEGESLGVSLDEADEAIGQTEDGPPSRLAGGQDATDDTIGMAARARRRTWLQYRIAKKKLLMSVISDLKQNCKN